MARSRRSLGGPRCHSYPRCQGVPVDGGQALKEDQLLVRMLSLWYMAEEGRTFAWRQGSLKSPPLKPHVGFMLEHPDSGEGVERFVFSDDHVEGVRAGGADGRDSVRDQWKAYGAGGQP